MRLEVSRDKFGIFKDAKIMDLSTEDWVVIQRSLKESLGSEQESLEYYRNLLELEIVSQCDPGRISDTKRVLMIIKDNISMLENIIQAFDTPHTTRVEDE